MSKKMKLVFAAAAAVLFIVVALPQATGIAAHEWVGLAAMVALLLHVAASSVTLGGLARAAKKGEAMAVARIALDAALFVALAACVVSGVLVSATVLPAFGLFAPGYFVWDPLHAASAKVLLALVLVHAASHAGKMAGMLKGKAGDNGNRR